MSAQRFSFGTTPGDGSPACVDGEHGHRVWNVRVKGACRQIDACEKRETAVSDHCLGEHGFGAPIIDTHRHSDGQGGIGEYALRKQERDPVLAASIVTPEGEPTAAAWQRRSSTRQENA